jgi:hypothetical protein
MKFPQDTAEGGFTIGDRKFVLFASFVLLPVDEVGENAGLIYRAGEVSSINAPQDAPIEMETARLLPQQLPAASLEDAALGLADELRLLGERIIAHQAEIAAQPADGPPASGQCCGGHCHADKTDVAVEAAIEAGDPDALLEAVEAEPATSHEPS